MRRIRPWQKEIECRECGDLLEVLEKDVSAEIVAISDILLYIHCNSCGQRIHVDSQRLPNRVWSRIIERCGVDLNRIKIWHPR